MSTPHAILEIDNFRDLMSFRIQPQSPLLRLPAELRNQIYEHVLGGFQICPTYPGKKRSRRARSLDTTPWNILIVCRQINAEARLLPFQLNEFNCDERWWFMRMVNKLSDEQLHAIETVRMRMTQFLCWFQKPRSSSIRAGYTHTRSLAKLSGLRLVQCTISDSFDNDHGIELQTFIAEKGLSKAGFRKGTEVEFVSKVHDLDEYWVYI